MTSHITAFEKECIFVPPNITLEGIKNIFPTLKSIPHKQKPNMWWRLEYIRKKRLTRNNLKWWQEDYIINKMKLA